MIEFEHYLPESAEDEEHPIAIAEALATRYGWEFDRVEGGNQIAIAVEGAWRFYSLSLAWSENDHNLRLVCTFEIKPPEKAYLVELYLLVNRVNINLYGSSFIPCCEDQEDQHMAYHAGLPLVGPYATQSQIEGMIDLAIATCDLYYPAIELAGWAGINAKKAYDKGVFEQAWGTA